MSFIYLRYVKSCNELSVEADLDEVSRDLIAPSSGEDSGEEDHTFDMDDRMITKKVWQKGRHLQISKSSKCSFRCGDKKFRQKKIGKDIPNIPLER